MIRMLQNWKGDVEIDNHKYSSISEYHRPTTEGNGLIHIKLYPKGKSGLPQPKKASVHEVANTEIIITVKKYMTQKSSPQFDFMAKWNHDNPMPLRTMVGHKIKETPGMVYMQLHGDIIAEKTSVCMCCGRKLTNPVSQYFGIGPECGSHNYVNPFNSDEELRAAVSQYKKQLQEIRWEGWVIKSAITNEEAVK